LGTCLHGGVRDGDAFAERERGTTQGAVLSPLLGTVSLHDVRDRWFETAVQPRRRGQATLIRSGEDVLMGVEREDMARRVLAVLDKRLRRFGLTLHPDKTRLKRLRRFGLTLHPDKTRLLPCGGPPAG